MDPTNTLIRNPVIINDSHFAPYTYDRSSVESAFNHGELKPFGIVTEQSFKEKVIPRHLVIDLNKYIIENVNNQDDSLENATEVADLDKVYNSPIYLSFPLDEKNTSSYVCTVDGNTYSKAESNKLLLAKINPINRQPINVQNFFEDKIAKKLFDHYQLVNDQKISNQEFSKILFKEFNGWKELSSGEKYFFIEVIDIKNLSKLKNEIILALSVMGFHIFINSNFSAMRILLIIDSYLLTRTCFKLFRAHPTFKFILRSVPFLLSYIIIVTDRMEFSETLYHLFYFIRSFFLIHHLFDSGEITNSFFRIYRKDSKCSRIASVIGGLYLIYHFLSAEYTRFFINTIRHLDTWRGGSLISKIASPQFHPLAYQILNLFLHSCLFLNNSITNISLKMVSFSYLTEQMRPANRLGIPLTENIALIASVKYSSWIKKAHFLFAILIGMVCFFFSFLNQQKNLGFSFLVGIDRLITSLLPLAFGSMMVSDRSENNKYRLLPRPQLSNDSKMNQGNCAQILSNTP